MNSWDKFDKTELPSEKDFYSKLNLEDISDKSFEHAQNVFEEHCKNMGDYHDLYVETDTIVIMIINMIQGYYIHLFQINHLVV